MDGAPHLGHTALGEANAARGAWGKALEVEAKSLGGREDLMNHLVLVDEDDHFLGRYMDFGRREPLPCGGDVLLGGVGVLEHGDEPEGEKRGGKKAVHLEVLLESADRTAQEAFEAPSRGSGGYSVQTRRRRP